MKKGYLITIALLCLIFTSNAQEENTEASNFGLKGGYNLAAVSFDGEEETGQRHSFHVGIYGESFVSKAVALQLELQYSQQGYQVKSNGGTFTQKLDYINIPLLFKMYPEDSFYLEVGPQAGFAISHKETFDSSFNLFDTSQEFEPNKLDWGINFGGGFKTNNGVSLGVRYHLGLGDIYENQGSPRNRVWQFSIGFDL